MIKSQRHWVISGGIGSGKSAVRGLLAEQGVSTIDADSIGHEVLTRNGPAFDEVVTRWPEVQVGDEIDRASLARIVFTHESELRALESITHPHIFGKIRDRVQRISGTVFVEIPLLDHELGPGWSRLIVDCADDVRLERLRSSGMDEVDARSRMSMQPSRAQWLAKADMVIPNHSDLEELRSNVQQMMRVLRN